MLKSADVSPSYNKLRLIVSAKRSLSQFHILIDPCRHLSFNLHFPSYYLRDEWRQEVTLAIIRHAYQTHRRAGERNNGRDQVSAPVSAQECH
jgi:hypothetical protein